MGAGGGRGDQDEHGGLGGQRAPLGTHGGCLSLPTRPDPPASNPRSDPSVNRGLCVMTLCQRGGHPSGGGAVDSGEAVPVWGVRQGV